MGVQSLQACLEDPRRDIKLTLVARKDDLFSNAGVRNVKVLSDIPHFQD